MTSPLKTNTTQPFLVIELVAIFHLYEVAMEKNARPMSKILTANSVFLISVKAQKS